MDRRNLKLKQEVLESHRAYFRAGKRSSNIIRNGEPALAETPEAKQARATVRQALEWIAPPRREVLVMYDLENVPMNQVAAALSIPLFTGYTRLRKARTELETALRRTSEDGSGPCHPFGKAFRIVSMHQRKLEHEVLEIRDGGPDPAEVLQAKQAKAMVMRAIEMIPLRRRAVLVMYDLESVPMRQVAKALSIPLFTAYSRLRKARTELETAIRRISRDGSPP